MTLSDSMFLFEIVVENLRSYIDCKEFYIKSQFANVFTLNLKDPNELDYVLFRRRPIKKKQKRKFKARNGKGISQTSGDAKVQTGQSVLFATTIELLISNMRKYPIELSLWSKYDPKYQLGSTHIPWSLVYIDYLNRLDKKQILQPVVVSGEYIIFDELTSKRMATIKLNIKLSYLNDKVTAQFRSLSECNQNTFMYTGFNSKPSNILNTLKDIPTNTLEDTGIIKTIYCAGKRKFNKSARNNKIHETVMHNNTIKDVPFKKEIKPKIELKKCIDRKVDTCRSKSIMSLYKSDTNIVKNNQVGLIKSKSCSSTEHQHAKILNYIFGDKNGPFGNQVYCVGYFTVENDVGKDTGSSKASSKGQISEKSEASKERYKIKICESECPSRRVADGTYSESVCSLDLPDNAANFISVTKCKEVECNSKPHQEVPPVPDDRILLDLNNFKGQCCNVSEKVEQVVGGMKAQIKFEGEPCLCTCECKFDFSKKTTYCSICGGYENVGEQLGQTRGQKPFPCPIFHKLTDKNKLKTWSASGSDSKKRADDSQRSLKGGTKSILGADKSVESEKDSKKSKKKKKDDRFKFNYGYQGIPPQIGHSQCAFSCTGALGTVPKNMGWLWTADNVPGLKFRPMWKPGAINKFVVRLLRMAKNPDEMLAKKRKKDLGKKKKSPKRPLLVIQKKDGEYTITMETMKSYPKPRALNQIPYEDKPVLTYTVGRTDEENRERQKKKEREQRRLERAQRQFIQSAFQDVCREICLKTYQQALGILPNAESPDCPCYPAHPDETRANMDVSCSCSEEKSSIGSDSDSDEWIVEFTPPNALFDPTFKSRKVQKLDNESQYTYLDYKVKLMDRHGNPVPRFFKGPDGKQQCSDLGGFWSPEHKWLEINVDGYIASDGRWAPNSFIGPNGEQVDSDTGKFQSANGKWLMVGIDGFIDCHGKWKFYPKPRGRVPPKRVQSASGKKGAGDKKSEKPAYMPSEATWSCFGDITPRQLSRMGIIGHGQDKKLLLSTLKDMLAHGEDVKIPEPSMVPRIMASKKGKSGGSKQRQLNPDTYDSRTYFQERIKCSHPLPSDKGIVAVDAHGHKAYFRLKDLKNQRPKQRLNLLKAQGISLSSFHMPCFHSFINTEVMKQQQIERLMALSAKNAKSLCVSTQVAHGWKPGAISKRLLQILNKAKLQYRPIKTPKSSRKLKKQTEEKPTLTISKKDGVYRVEMKVTPEIDSNMECTPLVYTIASKSNPDRIEHRERQERRLIREAVRKVWSDLYHPEVCETTCLKAYKQAIGISPYVPNNPECTNPDEEKEESLLDSCSCDADVSSECSLDVDWEIHFSPPIANRL